MNGCYYNEKSADDLFKELRYEKHDNHPEQDEPPIPNMWTTQDERMIEYIQTGQVRGQIAREVICFYPRGENVVCSAFINNRATVVPLNMQELAAINKKVQELDWIHEREEKENG